MEEKNKEKKKDKPEKNGEQSKNKEETTEKEEVEVPQTSEAFVTSEGFDVVSNREISSSLKQNSGSNLEDSLQDVQTPTEKKDEKKEKYIPFHYNDARRYASKAESINDFENREIRAVNAFKQTIMPKRTEEISVDPIPRRERPVSMIRENVPGFSEDIIKYKIEKKEIPDSPTLPKHLDRDKELKKYKMQPEFG